MVAAYGLVLSAVGSLGGVVGTVGVHLSFIRRRYPRCGECCHMFGLLSNGIFCGGFVVQFHHVIDQIPNRVSAFAFLRFFDIVDVELSPRGHTGAVHTCGEHAVEFSSTVSTADFIHCKVGWHDGEDTGFETGVSFR